jgi:hypothetical protein
MQTGFDFTGMREQHGDGYDGFMRRWMEMQQMLSGRGRAIPIAGKLLSSMVAAYGVQFVKKCCQTAKAPSWRRAQALMEVYEWLGDSPLDDDQAAALDSVFGRNLNRDQRAKVIEWIKEGRSAQDIDDLLEMIPPAPGSAPAPTVTEDDVRKWFAQMLEGGGWVVRMEQPTRDGGAVDIVATKDGKTKIVECKVDLDRKTAYFALGQLAVYAQSFSTRDWHVAYWHRESDVDPIVEACRGLCNFTKAVREVAEEVL